MTTRAKVGSKRKKPSEPEKAASRSSDSSTTLSPRFVRLKALQYKSLSQAEEKLADLRSIIDAKEKKVAQLEKE
ncbi:hypothetical protein Hanom_Chr01g00034141 [Helianthus anomalus]